jgi:stearoyl-CoA desaturase (Delta-9 desaturase)
MNTIKKCFNTGISTFLIVYQALFLLGLPFYFFFSQVQGAVVATAIVLFFLSGISITGGYHRLFSHRCYKAHPFIEAVVVFFGTLAAQGSVIRWSYDHRLHHAYVDTDNDPYSINKGFWYAHFLWLLEKPRTIEKKVVSDLFDNKLVAFQHKHYLSLVIGLNVIFCAFFAFLFSDFWGAFFLITWGRMFALHHSTWFINSLAHTWGDKPFSQEQSAVNNYVISFLTFGEGYHNYHHTFANDYRNGIRWYHFDPTKWVIWTLSKIGLTSHLKEMDAATIKKKMLIEKKRVLCDYLQDFYSERREELQITIDQLSDQLLEKLNKLGELRSQLRISSENSELLQSIQTELKLLQKSIQEDWKSWQQLSKHILGQKSITV